MRLICASDGKILLEDLQVARTLWTRTIGLLGRTSLPANQGLWILRCNSIHTFFMKFPLDLVFLNGKMAVTKTIKGVAPGRGLGHPGWRKVKCGSCAFLTAHWPVKLCR